MSDVISSMLKMYYIVYKYGPIHWAKSQIGIIFKKDVGQILSSNDELIIQIDHPDFQKICEDICGLVNGYERLVTVMSNLAVTLKEAQDHFDIKSRKNPVEDPSTRLRKYDELVKKMNVALNPVTSEKNNEI